MASIATLEIQSIDKTSCGAHANHLMKGNENIIIFNKSGVVYGTNPFTFGVCSFDLKLELQAAHHSSEDSSCIKLGYFFILIFLRKLKFYEGITNKSGKIVNIIGSTINYGLNRNSISIKVEFNVDDGILKIYGPSNPEGEVFNNIPQGVWYPAFQNKTAKNSNSTLQLVANFN